MARVLATPVLAGIADHAQRRDRIGDPPGRDRAVWVILMVGPRYRLWYGPLWSRKHEDGSWEVLIY